MSQSVAGATAEIDTVSASTAVRLTTPRAVRLVSFDAMRYGDTQVKVEWSTASEVNNDYFEVERSADAKVWQGISRVAGAGNSNQVINYSIMDDEPLAGTSYYRLRQVDMDSNITFSDMQSVYYEEIRQNATTMATYPNPVNKNQTLHIALNSPTDGISHILILNAMGEKVYESDASGSASYLLPSSELPTGIYTVNILTESNQKFVSRLVSQN
jgi:hypothetical protein